MCGAGFADTGDEWQSHLSRPLSLQSFKKSPARFITDKSMTVSRSLILISISLSPNDCDVFADNFPGRQRFAFMGIAALVRSSKSC